VKYGRRYREAIAATGLDYKTLRNYAVVARRFEFARRREDLTFHHHAEVCALTDEDQQIWLDRAAENGWSKAELRRQLRGARTATPEGGTTVVRLVLESGRVQRWRNAARQTDCDLETWIESALDRAADHVFDRQRRLDGPSDRRRPPA
jgi:hypothetical protein